MRKTFAIKSYIRSYHTSAFRTLRDRAFGFEDEIIRIFLMTLHAVITECRTVYFLYVLASRSLMKTVNILRNDTVELACLLHLGKLIVRSVRFDTCSVEFLSVELIENIRVIDKTVDTQEILRAVPVELNIMLIIKSVLTSEIRDTALS